MPLSVLRGARAPQDTWTEHDRTTATALTLYEAALCSGCGHPLTETTGPDVYHAGNRDGTYWFEAPDPVVCHGCAALHTKRDEYKDVDDVASYRFRAVKATDDDPAE